MAAASNDRVADPASLAQCCCVCAFTLLLTAAACWCLLLSGLLWSSLGSTVWHILSNTRGGNGNRSSNTVIGSSLMACGCGTLGRRHHVKRSLLQKLSSGGGHGCSCWGKLCKQRLVQHSPWCAGSQFCVETDFIGKLSMVAALVPPSAIHC
eukprot:GHUV01025850.1.p1 GENE.GHUV01025850.1~~GHUV01025850.1.p1  ORF type:complete len:152 (-),score=40.36 GHUV01025850.1:51-506(-)